MTIERLYGLPDVETMYDDPATVWESEIEPDYIEGENEQTWTIEEWDVHEPGYHMPNLDRVVDYIRDCIFADGEVTEDGGDAFANAVDDDVFAVFQAALNLWASKVDFRMAKDLIATHTLTIIDGEPHLDGMPLYTETEK